MKFKYCISETNNIQVDNAKDVDVVMPMYNLIEYNSKYVKASETLCQYHKHDPNDDMTDTQSCKLKLRLTNETNNPGIANVEIAV